MNAPLITAHSGSDKTRDNSIEFILYALSQPINCFEVDVRKNKEDKLILAHDDGDYSCELKEAFVELSKHPSKKINCDLKIFGLEIEVFELAKQMKVENQLIFSGSISFEVVRNNIWITDYIEWYVNIELILCETFLRDCSNIDNFSYIQVANHIKELLEKHKAKCLNINYLLYNTKLMNAIAETGVPLSLWTPSEAEELDKLMFSKNILNITTRNVKYACLIKNQ